MSDESVLDYRVRALEESVSEIKSAVKSIDASLQTLARLEVRHAETRDGLERAFGEIARVDEDLTSEIHDHEKRIRDVEREMPSMQQVKTWVYGGVTGGVSLMAIAVAALVLK